MWTKHTENGLGLDLPFYMKRKDAGSLASYMAVRERVRSNGRLATRWALYDLDSRECRLIVHYRTLREAKTIADSWCAGRFGHVAG